MSDRRWVRLVILAAGLALLATATAWAASSGQEAAPEAVEAEVGPAFTYQGRLQSDGAPVTDRCDMVFALFDGPGPKDRQIGRDLRLEGVPVNEGLFTVQLDFGSLAFQGDGRWLDIAVRCSADRDPVNLGRQELTAVPYALYALDAPWDGLPYAGVVVVAKSGGDYSSVQAAIDSISGATAESPYLVWIAPGVYQEEVTMVPYVHLQGAGQGATVIRSDATATVVLASYASLRDLTVENHTTTSLTVYAVRVAPSDNVTGTLVAQVEARALGSGQWNYGIKLEGSDTGVTLRDVMAHAEGGSHTNHGLSIRAGAWAIVEGGSYSARGEGVQTYGIFCQDSGVRLEATDVVATAEGGSTAGGLRNYDTAVLRGGSYAGRGGDDAYGIVNYGSRANLEAHSVTAEAFDIIGTAQYAYGLISESGASATLYGGRFTGQGGDGAAGIVTTGSGSTLEAHGVTAQGQDGAVLALGLNNSSGCSTVLDGGSFTGVGGFNAYGISNQFGGSLLEARGIVAQGKDGSNWNYGLHQGSADWAVVWHSVLRGATNSVINNGAGNVTLSHVQLHDGPISGDVDCVAVSSGWVFSPDSCP